MSIDATRWAWKQPIKSNLKIILLSLADRAGENHDCYPSLARLALDCALSRSSVIRALNDLEKLNLITITQRKTNKSNTSNYYKLISVEDRHARVNNSTQTPPLVSHRQPPSIKQTPPLVSHRHPPSVTQTPRTNHLNNQVKHNNNTPQISKMPSDKKTLLFLFLNEKQKSKAISDLENLSTEQQALAILIYEHQATKGIDSFKTTPANYWKWIIDTGKKGALQQIKSTVSEEITTQSQEIAKITGIEKINKLIKNPENKEKMLTDYKKNKVVFIQGYGLFYKDELKKTEIFN